MKCTLMQIPVNAAENIHCCKTLPWGRINCRFSHSVRDWNIYREILVQKKYDPNKHCTVLLDLCSVSQILTVIPVIFFPPAFQHPIYRQGSKFFFFNLSLSAQHGRLYNFADIWYLASRNTTVRLPSQTQISPSPTTWRHNRSAMLIYFL